MSQPDRKGISVILCTWNNSKRLRVTLEAIEACEIPDGLDWELVVVNNNSTDDTETVIRQFESRLPVTYVFEPKQGLSNARNAGLAAATGHWVLFTDDDVRPYPQWIAAYWRSFAEQGERYFYGGPLESEFEGTPPPASMLKYAPWSVKGLNWGDTSHEATAREKFVSANWACTRAALIEAGGFDPNLGLNPASGEVRVGEESDLMQRLRDRGCEAWYIADALLRHYVPMDKVNLQHIGDRQQAYAYYKTLRQGEVARSKLMVKGYPARLLKRAVTDWFVWRWDKIRGRDFAEEYIQWRSLLGRMEASRDVLQGKASIVAR